MNKNELMSHLNQVVVFLALGTTHSGKLTYFYLMNISEGPFKHFLAYISPL